MNKQRYYVGATFCNRCFYTQMAKLRLQGRNPKAIRMAKYNSDRTFICFKCRKTETVLANHKTNNMHRIYSYDK